MSAHYPVGVCSWTFGDTPIEEIAREVAQLGFDGLELHGDLDTFTPEHINRLMAEHKLQVFSLTPDNVNIVHPDAVERSAAMDYYRRLIDFAAALDSRPKVSCHTDVGRVAALTAQRDEEALLRQSMGELCHYAAQRDIEIVFEVLNRYETNLICNALQGMDLIGDVAPRKLQLLLDCYHMNIEEPNIAEAIHCASGHLGLFHIADSNRCGIGSGHTDFEAVFEALEESGYAGPVILEMSAPGPNPFTPVKEGDFRAVLKGELSKSLQWIQARAQAA